MNIQEKTASFPFGKISLNYSIFSDKADSGGIPLVSFHGTGFTARTYLPVFRELVRKGYAVYALNFMGHGGSQVDMNFRNWFYFRDQVLAFLEHLNFERVTGIGHSLGGASLLLASARDTSDRLCRLVALDPVVSTPFMSLFSPILSRPLVSQAQNRRRVFESYERVEERFHRLPPFEKWTQESLRLYVRSAFRKREDGKCALLLPPEAEARIYGTLRYGHWREYRRISKPILVITESRPHVCPRSSALKLMRGNRRSLYLSHPTGTHFFPMEDPVWTAKRILEFCAED